MSFLAPLLLLGLGTLLLPLVAHRLGREEPKLLRFAGLRFLQAADPSVKRRKTLRDRTLLLIRLFLLALLALALARPVIHEEISSDFLSPPHDAVVVFDLSGSMDLVRSSDGRSELDRAQEQFQSLANSLAQGSRLGVVFSDPNFSPIPLNENIPAVVAATESVLGQERRPGNWPLVSTLEPAEELFGSIESKEPTQAKHPRAIYFLSDPTEHGLASLPSQPRTADAPRLIPITSRQANDPVPERLGILNAQVFPAPELGPGMQRIQAEIQRLGASEESERKVSVELKVGSSSTAEVTQSRVLLNGNQRKTVEFSYQLNPQKKRSKTQEQQKGDASAQESRRNKSDGPTPATLTLRLNQNDPLPHDDRRDLWLQSDAPLRLWIVNGDPREQRALDEIFFLVTALHNSKLADRMQIRTFNPEGFADELNRKVSGSQGASLSDADLLILANLSAPSAEHSQLIQKAVSNGLGLWITAGDRIAPEVYNQNFADLLPLPLRGASSAGETPTLQAAAQSKDGPGYRDHERLAPVHFEHPIFSLAPSQSSENDSDTSLSQFDVSSTQNRKILLLEPNAKGEDKAQIALSYERGAPALITRSFESGRVALLTTTIDRGWSDLALRPGFVSIVQATVQWLAKRSDQSSATDIAIGESIAISNKSIRSVLRPNGTKSLLPQPKAASQSRSFAPTLPGHYVLGSQRLSAYLDPRESDIDFQESKLIPSASSTDDDSDEATLTIEHPIWRWFLWAVFGLLVFESFLRQQKKR